MTLYLPPNMEALVSAFLREQPEVIAMVGDRVWTAVPKADEPDPRWPGVRVTQLLDEPNGSPLWAIGYVIQVDAWGGSKGDAFRIANVCRAVIDARIVGVHDGYGVVNGSSPGSLLDLPDEDFSPAKPRWLFTSTIYARPLATLSTS